MERGERVRLRAYGDRVIERRVVGQSGEVVHVCTDEEFREAERRGRKPVSVGFAVGDVIKEDQPSGA